MYCLVGSKFFVYCIDCVNLKEKKNFCLNCMFFKSSIFLYVGFRFNECKVNYNFF